MSVKNHLKNNRILLRAQNYLDMSQHIISNARAPRILPASSKAKSVGTRRSYRAREQFCLTASATTRDTMSATPSTGCGRSCISPYVLRPMGVTPATHIADMRTDTLAIFPDGNIVELAPSSLTYLYDSSNMFSVNWIYFD